MSDNQFDNIEEQRHWNLENAWIDSGNEWNHQLGMDYMWDEYIGPMIQPYAKGNVLEIACGFGRITNEVLTRCKEVDLLYVVDLNETCIYKCVQRFGRSIAGYFVNDGKTLRSIPDNYLDFIFSYDSFVHMHFNVVVSYIKEIHRTLKPGGSCSLHLSGLVGGTELSFSNLGGRAVFDMEKFEEILSDLGMTVKKSVILRANHFSEIDDYYLIIEKDQVESIFKV